MPAPQNDDQLASVTGASRSDPIVITASAPLPSDIKEIKVDGVAGNDAANGSFFVKATDKSNTTFALYSDSRLTKTVAGTGDYQSGGTIYNPFWDDYAIVVGINNYPAFNPLHGPETDASLFYKWLISRNGANLAMSHVQRILSSDFNAPDPQDFTTWQPALDALKATFWKYSSLAIKNDLEKKNSRVGRRLWVFLAGHGITPTKTPGADLDDAALLAASADVGRYGEHLTAYSWIEWFKNAAAFDEIVLFMDYCRDLKNNVSPIPCTLDPMIKDRRSDVRMLYAAATDLNSQSWEDKMGDDDNYHGFFSYALMQALKNEALLDGQGRLTAGALIQQLTTEVPRLRPDQTPRFLPRPPHDITIVQRLNAVKPNVDVSFSTAFSGQKIQLFLGSDLTQPIDTYTVNGGPWKLHLDAFKLYKLVASGGQSQILEVKGDAGGNHVQFI